MYSEPNQNATDDHNSQGPSTSRVFKHLRNQHKAPKSSKIIKNIIGNRIHLTPHLFPKQSHFSETIDYLVELLTLNQSNVVSEYSLSSPASLMLAGLIIAPLN